MLTAPAQPALQQQQPTVQYVPTPVAVPVPVPTPVPVATAGNDGVSATMRPSGRRLLLAANATASKVAGAPPPAAPPGRPPAQSSGAAAVKCPVSAADAKSFKATLKDLAQPCSRPPPAGAATAQAEAFCAACVAPIQAALVTTM